MRWLGVLACALVVGPGVAAESERSLERRGYVPGLYFIRLTDERCAKIVVTSREGRPASIEEFAQHLQSRLQANEVIADVLVVRSASDLGLTVRVRKNRSGEFAQVVIQREFNALRRVSSGAPGVDSNVFPVPRLAASSRRPTWGQDRIDQRPRKLDHQPFAPVGTGANVTVYVLDTGVNPNHSEFREGSVSAFELGNEHRRDLEDPNGHGTFVAALIAGKTLGVAPDADIVSMQVLDADGFVDGDRLNTALESLAEHLDGTRNVIVNLSLSGPASKLSECAVKHLVDKSAILVGAAGNTNGGNAGDYFPGELDDIITVGSSTRRDHIAIHSSTGPAVDIYAPGVSIRSANSRSERDEIILGGSSAAAAFVSGGLAAILSNPELGPGRKTAQHMLAYLSATGTPVIKDRSLPASSELLKPSAPPLQPLLYVGEELERQSTGPQQSESQALAAAKTPGDKRMPAPMFALGDAPPLDLAASVVYADTSNEALGYGPIDALIDRETRISIGRAWRLRHSWRVAPVLEVASRMTGDEHLLDSGRYQLGGDASYALGEHEFGFGVQSALYERGHESVFASSHAAFGYGWTPGAGGSCTPMTLGVYVDLEQASDKQVGSSELFDQSGHGRSLALRFMNERPKRGTSCAYGSLLSAPSPSTGRWLDFWAGLQSYDADGRAWDSRGWFLRGKSSFSIRESNLHIEPAFLFASTSFDNTLITNNPNRGPEGPGLDWSLPNRFQRDRAWSITGRYTLPAGPHRVLDFSLTLSREHRFSNVDDLSNDRKVVQFGITIRPVNVLNKKWGGATGGGTTVVVGGGGPSGGPRPDPTTTCTAPPPC